MFPPSRTRLVALAAAVVLVVAACGSDEVEPEPGNDVAASVITSVESTLGTVAPEPETTEVPEGCRIERTEDEYGFPVDVVVCDGETEPEPQPGTELPFVEWAGTDEAERVAFLIRDAVVVGGGCIGDELIRDLALASAAAPADVREPLQGVATEIAQAATFCGSDPLQWEEHLEAAIASLEEFVRVADALRVAAREAGDG